MRLLKHEMEEENRKTGIDIIGDASWGTHFCQFYQTREDLIDVLVPYFKAGLENNEFCMWVTSEPLSEEEAKEAMRKAVPDFDLYLKRGQMEIVPHTEWYLKDGAFNLKRVLNAWIDKLNQALAKGYDGVRVTGNTAWLEKRNWRSFVDYEKEVNDVIGKYRMMAICTYSLDKCGASEVLDVVRNHHFCLVRRRGEWELIESSELKRTKEALEDSEKKYRNLIDSAPVGIYKTNLKGGILFVNAALARMFEFESPEEMMLQGVLQRYKNRKDREVLIENLKKKGKVENFELEVLTKTGRPKNVLLSAFLDGDTISGMIIDITERKRAEEALKESEEKFRNIFESANDCMIFLDSSGRILDVNGKTVQVFGGSKEELLGKHFMRVGIFSREDMRPLESTFANILAGKEDNIDICVKNKKGQEILLECSASLMKIDDKIAGMMVIARDVTERKKAEKALKESEKKLRDVIDTSPDAIVWVDTTGKITLVNRKGFELTGFSEEDLIGKNFMDVEALTQESKEKILENFIKRLEGIDTPPYEVEIVTKNGEVIPAEISASLIFEEGKIVGTQSIFRDLRERKKMERKLQEYAEHLEEMVEERTRELKEAQERLLKSERLAAIGQLATMVGHDLRNPLQSIENATYYLNNELPCLSASIPIPQKTMEMLQVINDSVNYADRIIRDLQDFSATKKPILKKTNINAIVKETLSQVEAPENVGLITELGHLPEIKADKDMIKRVFLNLAVNGIQAMENGGRLKVSTKKTKGFVEVSFKDTGVGISKENMKKIFTPFFTTKAKGMGMGLPICKKLVDAHGGSIEVESEEGKGTTFTVKLPIQ